MDIRLARRFALLAALLPASLWAAVDAPDHVLYGNVTVFGAPAPYGTVVEVRANPAGHTLARYVLGRDTRLGAQFALRIPMDVVDPRRDGRARTGDPVQVFVGGQLAAETAVGAEGVAVRLDLDPQAMGAGPGVTVADQARFEGQSGSAALRFPVALNTTSELPVSVEWQTQPGTATGGVACGPGVDYVTDSGTAVIPAGQLEGLIDVQICGDTVVEPDEQFNVLLTRVVNGVAARTTIVGTILDDDNIPAIRIAPVRVAEPASGTAAMEFTARLSRSTTVEVRFNWATQALEAQSGSDFVAASGVAVIPAGEVEARFSVQVLADGTVEPPERLRIALSNPQQASLAEPTAYGTIIDPGHTPVIEHEFAFDDTTAGIPALVNPSDIELSPEGLHAYVASETGDAVLLFNRDAQGALTFVRSYTSATAGFADARLDGARDLQLSADGLTLYVAAHNSHAINVLRRAPDTGELVFAQVQHDGQTDAQAAGGTVRGLNGATALALSPDGAHLYAVAAGGNAVSVFARDAADGRLRFLEAETQGADDPTDAGPAVVALDRPSGLALSRDGRQLYVASRLGDALLVFDRTDSSADAAFGRLSFRTAHRDGLLGIEGLDGAFALAVSPDDRHVYVASEADSAVVLFDRAADGALTRRTQWTRGDLHLPGLGGARAIRLSDDGRELYVAGFGDHSLTVFRRSTDPGAGQGLLTPLQSVFDGDGANTLMAGPIAVALSPDGRSVYVAANQDNAIVRFGRVAVTRIIFNDGFD